MLGMIVVGISAVGTIIDALVWSLTRSRELWPGIVSIHVLDFCRLLFVAARVLHNRYREGVFALKTQRGEAWETWSLMGRFQASPFRQFFLPFSGSFLFLFRVSSLPLFAACRPRCFFPRAFLALVTVPTAVGSLF